MVCTPKLRSRRRLSVTGDLSGKVRIAGSGAEEQMIAGATVAANGKLLGAALTATDAEVFRGSTADKVPLAAEISNGALVWKHSPMTDFEQFLQDVAAYENAEEDVVLWIGDMDVTEPVDIPGNENGHTLTIRASMASRL